MTITWGSVATLAVLVLMILGAARWVSWLKERVK